MLRAAGYSKKAQKIQECQPTTSGISGSKQHWTYVMALLLCMPPCRRCSRAMTKPGKRGRGQRWVLGAQGVSLESVAEGRGGFRGAQCLSLGGTSLRGGFGGFRM